MKEKEFWVDGFTGQARGGVFYRSFEFNKFIEKVEEQHGKVVGLKFSGHNVELITEVPEVTD